MKEKIGVVDVGGGLRGIYAAGVFDYCMDKGIWFDLGIGVSAGSANLASYLAKQPRRNYQFFSEYALRKEYMSAGNFMRTKSYIGLDYIYGTLSNSDGENPLDYEEIEKNPMELYVVASDARNGEVKYFNKADIKQDCYDVFKASCAIPAVCQPYIIQEIPYYDGALADPVPIKKAFELGCEKVVLILTLPREVKRDRGQDEKLAKLIKKKYPLAAERLLARAERYNKDVEWALELEKQGKAIVIAPDDTCGVDTLSRDKENLCRLYQKGYDDAGRITLFVR